jgi:phenylacetate-CoA ligase
MNPWLSRLLSERLLDRKGGHRKAVLDAWHAKQLADFWSADERRAQQAKLLTELLNHCRAKVPFYQKLLRDAAEIRPLNAFEILQQLPIVTRTNIQQEPDQFLAAGEAVAGDDATGGSTGTPMQFKVDRPTQIARESSLMWADSHAGWQPGERIAMLWGSDRDVRSATRSVRLAMRWWIENRRWFDAFEAGPDEMRRYHHAIARFQPHYLVGYASALRTFAQFLETEKIKPDYPRNAIVSSAEVLTQAARETVEQVFQRPVFDRYGNREFGAIAAECSEHAGLHVNPLDVIVEKVPMEGAEGLFRIVVTYLPNRVMPFLRYDTGDLARWLDGLCVCGRTTARLREMVGRQSDVIRLKSGRMIHGEFFTHLFYKSHGVRSFQFVQEDIGSFVLRVETSPEFFDSQAPEWRRRLLEALGADAQLEIIRVDRIPATASGKHRFTISKVQG